ncbi:MAG: hypothetical protein PHC38_02245 [Weeksellaceae bacterium]|nr:hypothetical protein [Weeksellaceae bacterium]
MALLFSVTVVNAQSSCSCDELFGSCSIACPKGTLAKCKGTWYGSCSCECMPTASNPDTGVGSIDLNEVKEMKKIFETISSPKLDSLNNLIDKLESKSENNIFVAKNEDEYYLYFNQLHELFLTLPKINMEDLVNKIEA